MEVRLTAYGLDAWKRGLQQAPEMARKEMLRAATEATMLLEYDLKTLGNYPYDTGVTQRSIEPVAFATPVGVLGQVGSPSPVAGFLEFGTKHMKARPSFPAAWERRKEQVGRLFEDAAGRIAMKLGELPGGMA